MDLQLDPLTGAFVQTKGDLAFTSGIDAIAQDLTICLQFFKGEWFLDPDIGVPYFEQVFVKNPNLDAIRVIFRSVILSRPGVLSLSDFTVAFDAKTRVLRVKFTAETDEGPLTYNRELVIT